MATLIESAVEYTDFDTTSADASTTLTGVVGKCFEIKNSGSGGNLLTVTYGSDSVVFDDGESGRFVYDGGGWATLFSSGGGDAQVSVSIEAGEDLLANEPFYVGSDSKAYKANNTTEVTAKAMGLVDVDTLLGGTFEGVTLGVHTWASHSYTVGATYYLGSTGNFVLKSSLLATDLIYPTFTVLDVDTVYLSFGPLEIPTDALVDQLILPILAGEAMDHGDPYYIHTDGKAYKAINNGTDAEALVKGIVSEAVVLDDSFQGSTFGLHEIVAHGYTVASDYYLGNSTQGNFILRGAVNTGDARVPCFTPLDADNIFVKIAYPEQDAVSKEVGEIFLTTALSELDGCKWADYSTLSQSIYAELFKTVGHTFAKDSTDAGAAEGSGLFHLPDASYLFARGGKTWNVADTDFTASSASVTVTGHGLTADQNGRPIKLVRNPGTSPTMPTASGYTEYDQMYLAYVDADTLRFYTTEADAIADDGATNILTWSAVGSGSFLLSSIGCYQKSAVEDHGHEFIDSAGNRSGFRTTETISGGGSTYQGVTPYAEPDNDGEAGQISQNNLTSKTSDNETRPSFVSLGMQIKVIASSASTGEAYDVMVSTFSGTLPSPGNSILLTHGFGVAYKDLITKLVVNDGTNYSDAIIINVSGVYGEIFIPNDLNSFYLQTGQTGARGITSTGVAFIATNYEVTVYKPDLFARTYVSGDVIAYDDYAYTITENTNGNVITLDSSITTQKTITLSKGSLASISNRVKIYNKSAYTGYHLITDGTTTWWLEAGKTVEYFFDGSALMRGAGKELVYDGPSGAAINESAFKKPIDDLAVYEIQSKIGTAQYLYTLKCNSSFATNFGQTIGGTGSGATTRRTVLTGVWDTIGSIGLLNDKVWQVYE